MKGIKTKELKELGFYRINKSELYINSLGEVFNIVDWNITAPKVVMIRKAKIKANKALLFMFRGTLPANYKETPANIESLLDCSKMKKSKEFCRSIVENCKELEKRGFYPINETNLLISESGEVFNSESKQYSRPRKIKIRNSEMKIEKVLMWVFNNVPPRNSFIRYVNGDKRDKRPANLTYCSLAKETNKSPKVSKENLKLAIRCFFEVEKSWVATQNSITTRMYLDFILRKYLFSEFVQNKPFAAVFIDYVNDYFTNVKKLAKRHNLTVIDANNVINRFYFELTNKILSFKLDLQPFQKSIYQRETAKLKELGMKRKMKYTKKQYKLLRLWNAKKLLLTEYENLTETEKQIADKTIIALTNEMQKIDIFDLEKMYKKTV